MDRKGSIRSTRDFVNFEFSRILRLVKSRDLRKTYEIPEGFAHNFAPVAPIA